jgi:hypothetical protein
MSHRLNEFIPTYVVHSDYLSTNQVVDNRQTEAQQLVHLFIFSSNNMRLREQEEECLLNDQLISIQEDMFLLELMRMLRLTSLFLKSNSRGLSEND